MAGTPGSSGGGSANAALAGIGYASEAFQLGLGNSYSQATPFDLYVSPTSGSTVTPLTGLLVVNAAGTINALTVQFPSNATEGYRLRIISNQIVTTLTLTAGTNSVTGGTDTINAGASTLAVNTPIEYCYKLTQATSTTGQPTAATNLYTWYRIQ
jgi:hypothetical protein